MRELKFRMVTQTTGKVLGYVDIYDLLRNGSDVLPDFEEAILEGVKFEQYTGLKDKNGKEIYDGDILQNADGEIATVVWCKETAEWGIEWSDCGVRDSLSWRMECVKESDSLNEVIGNIHENQELLGGKK